MLKVAVAPRSLSPYQAYAAPTLLDELYELARPLRGLRVAHVNATLYGGGVSELLRSVVPLERSLGLDVDWLVIPGTTQFFHVTKKLHNALQGAPLVVDEAFRTQYLANNAAVAKELKAGQYDVYIVHDPQPAALRVEAGSLGAKWVWRCHIDSSQPSSEAAEFLSSIVQDYDCLVFTLGQFVPASLRGQRTVIIAPAIDPLSPKNLALSPTHSKQIVEWTGVHLDRKLMTQVSRFDPWKDPLGVIRVYRKVRERVPGLQLALLGQMALDDPEGWDMYNAIEHEVADDADIHVLTNFTGIGHTEVNAFQRQSNIVIQKSIREGFGLVVSETLWKGVAVVSSAHAGGIPLQMPDGVGGILVRDDEEYVEACTRLLKDQHLAQELGARGQAHVREHFLITRLLRDELTLLASL